jgi:hydrogenase/urease accessory protein HupE
VGLKTNTVMVIISIKLAQAAWHESQCRADGREVWEWAGQVAFVAGFTLTGYTIALTGVCPVHARDAKDPQGTGEWRWK